MNKKLKFSWGHIIAFVALIIVSYISFVGFTYLTNGNFVLALIGMGLTDIFYMLFFIGAQQMKATDEKFNKKIIWERILVFGSPLIFVVGMISMSHFWTVFSQNDEIVKSFQSSINGSKQLFIDYETYANQRIEAYDKGLAKLIGNQSVNPKALEDAGFSADVPAQTQRENMVRTLRLQLLSKNFEALQTSANEWIDKASHGAHTANVFLLGNTREIKEALTNWEKQLREFSEKEMSNEAQFGPVDHFRSDGARNAIKGIDSLTSAFTTQKSPTLYAIIFGIVMYLFLLFPYMIQERHTKTIQRLVGKEKEVKTVKANTINPTSPVSAEDADYRSF